MNYSFWDVVTFGITSVFGVVNFSHHIMFLTYAFIIFYPKTQNYFKHRIVLHFKNIRILVRSYHQKTRLFFIC